MNRTRSIVFVSTLVLGLTFAATPLAIADDGPHSANGSGKWCADLEPLVEIVGDFGMHIEAPFNGQPANGFIQVHSRYAIRCANWCEMVITDAWYRLAITDAKYVEGAMWYWGEVVAGSELSVGTFCVGVVSEDGSPGFMSLGMPPAYAETIYDNTDTDGSQTPKIPLIRTALLQGNIVIK